LIALLTQIRERRIRQWEKVEALDMFWNQARVRFVSTTDPQGQYRFEGIPAGKIRKP